MKLKLKDLLGGIITSALSPAYLWEGRAECRILLALLRYFKHGLLYTLWHPTDVIEQSS